MKKIVRYFVYVIIYIIGVVSISPINYAQQQHKKLTVSNEIRIMKIQDIQTDKNTGLDKIIFADKNYNSYSTIGDLQHKYKGRYAIVVIQNVKELNRKNVIDYILKEDIEYITYERIKDILML